MAEAVQVWPFKPMEQKALTIVGTSCKLAPAVRKTETRKYKRRPVLYSTGLLFILD
ncbi:hypothetical protein [Pontibacter rugosus]